MWQKFVQTQVICCFHLRIGVESLFLECFIDFKACFYLFWFPYAIWQFDPGCVEWGEILKDESSTKFIPKIDQT